MGCRLGYVRVMQAKGKQDRRRVTGKNRYVIKVMNSHREGGQVLLSARTKGCPKPFNWSIINLLYLFKPIIMQGRFKMECRLFTIGKGEVRQEQRQEQMQDTKRFEDRHPVAGPGLSGALGPLRRCGEGE
jgi:hypothetical protein